MDFYKVSNMYIQEGIQQKYLDQMEQKSNKKREEEKYDVIQPITRYATSNTARETETELLKWVDDYERNIKRKKKAEVVELPKKWRPLDQELVQAYDELEGDAPSVVKITPPDLTSFDAEIDTFTALLDKTAEDGNTVIDQGIALEERIKALNNKKQELDSIIKNKSKSQRKQHSKRNRETENEMMMIEEELTRLNDVYQRLKIQNTQNKKDYAEIQGKLTKSRSDKADAIKPYEDAQKAFQGTAFNLSRLPTETEEQYINRLQENEELVINAQQKADLMRQGIISRFKKNIASLVLNAGLTEQINNTIENACNFDPDDVQARLFINKNFIRFREYYNSYL